MIRKLLLTVMMATALFAVFAAPDVFAQSTRDAVCQGVGQAGAGCSGSNGVNNAIRVIINILSSIIGVVSVVMILLGGFKYVTSGGDSSNIKSAKDTILFAIVGLIIVALAQSIVRFVLGSV